MNYISWLPVFIEMVVTSIVEVQRKVNRMTTGLSKNKGIHEITESDKISYAVICDKFQSPHIYFNTYKEAERWARFDQPNDRPFYIVKRSEHFEIVGEVR